MSRRMRFVACLILSIGSLAQAQSTDELARKIGSDGTGTQGGVAAGGAEAVAIGLEILRNGGNAADSAAASILALSVTDSRDFCFGGEVPILVYDARRKVVEAVSGMGVAPRLATREHFARKAGSLLTARSRNAADPGGIPLNGIEPAATPATLGACLTLLERYGTLTFAEAVAPTLQILDRKAIDWHPRLAATLRRLVEAERFSPDDRLRGLRLVADYFYRGPVARDIAAWSEKNGGLIRYEDLATHVTRVEEPASVDYRGYTVYKCGAWTQGPYVLEALRLLEGFDLKKLGHNRPDTIHITIEAMKLAFADRDVYYADPLFVDVPLVELLSPAYASLRRPLIDVQKASLVQRPGDPRGGRALLAEESARRGLGAGVVQDTTTCTVADRWGNMIAATPSGWSGVEAGETGVWLGSRLQSFNLWEGHPNCIAPGKRPRITLTPSLVLNKDRQPVLAVSVAGGDGQDQAGIQMILNHIDFGLSPVESVSTVRFGTNHHVGSFRQTPPELGSLLIYPQVGEETMADLARRGHTVKPGGPPLWSPVVIRRDPETGRLDAAGDAKAGRHAAAF